MKPFRHYSFLLHNCIYIITRKTVTISIVPNLIKVKNSKSLQKNLYKGKIYFFTCKKNECICSLPLQSLEYIKETQM